MRRLNRRDVARAVIAIVAAALALPVCAAPSVEAGRQSAQVCLACHGEAGISQMKEVPSLGGQHDQFIQWQLVYFRSGVRKNPIMGPLSSTLKDEDIRNIGAYFATLAPPKPAPADGADDALKKSGEMVARGNHCASCHGDDFSGDKIVPRTAGQREDYLLKALRDFKSGQRSGGGGAAMPEAVYHLSDSDLQALAHFLATFP